MLPPYSLFFYCYTLKPKRIFLANMSLLFWIFIFLTISWKAVAQQNPRECLNKIQERFSEYGVDIEHKDSCLCLERIKNMQLTPTQKLQYSLFETYRLMSMFNNFFEKQMNRIKIEEKTTIPNIKKLKILHKEMETKMETTILSIEKLIALSEEAEKYIPNKDLREIHSTNWYKRLKNTQLNAKDNIFGKVKPQTIQALIPSN